MISNQDLAKKSFLVTSVVVLTFSFFYVFYKSSAIFLSALIGIGVSSLIVPFINQLEEKFKVPRSLGAIALLMLIAIFFLIAFLLIGSVLYEQYDGLRDNLPAVIKNWEYRWNTFTNKYPQVENLLKNQSSSSGLTESVLSYVALTFSGIISAITGITLATVIALFTSINAEKYYDWIMNTVSEDYKEALKERLCISRETLQNWFSAQLIDMAIIGVITAFSLWIFGIKYWALFGFITGVLVIIPYLGILLAVVFAGCVIMVIQPDKIVWLLAVFTITQQIEGGIILPMIMNDKARIPAAPLIFFMALFGTWFGVLGVLVTPPLMAIIFSQYRFSLKSGD